MRVIGVDPGYDRLGVAIVEIQNGVEVLLFSDCITSDRTLPFPARLQEIGMAFSDLLHTHKPDALAIETLFFNQNQKTVMGVAQTRGILIYLAARNDCEIFEFGPQEVKVAMTGYGKSDKQAVISMVKQLVKGAPLEAFDDEYDAIAVGITCLAHHARGR